MIPNRTPVYVVNFPEITWENQGSPEFLYKIVEENNSLLERECFFYLDAHFGEEIDVLHSEIKFILDNFEKYYIIVDDCDINNILFLNNGYKIDDIQEKLSDKDTLYVPNYTEQTSEFHDLCGWALITNIEDDYINMKEYK